MSSASPNTGYRLSRAPQRGFTLMEVIISITLLSVALSLLVGGFRFTSRAWDAGAEVSSETADLETVHRVFGNMVERMFPISLDRDDGHEFAFLGSDKRLRFAAYLPPYPASGGLYILEFSIRSEGDKNLMQVNLATFGAVRFDESELPEEQQTLLLETTRMPSFAYLGENEWQEQWTDASRLPRYISIRFQGGTPPWPELVRRVKIDADLACLYPDTGGHCRLDN